MENETPQHGSEHHAGKRTSSPLFDDEVPQTDLQKHYAKTGWFDEGQHGFKQRRGPVIVALVQP